MAENSTSRLLGVLLIIVGGLIGIGYPYLLLVASEKQALKIIIYTIIVISILLGSFIGAVGGILLRGFKGSEEAEDTS